MMMIILHSLGIVIGALAIFTNGVLLVILIKDPLNFFKSTTTYFIISLALADMITGANACIWGINNFYPSKLGEEPYLLAVFWFTIQASFLTLLAMSAERFFIVKYPFDSRGWITKKRVCWSIVVIWLVSFTLGSLIILPYPQKYIVQLAIFTEFFISVFVITGLYVSILLSVRKSKKAFSAHGMSRSAGRARDVNPVKTSYQLSVRLITSVEDANVEVLAPQSDSSGLSPNISQEPSQNGGTNAEDARLGTEKEKHAQLLKTDSCDVSPNNETSLSRRIGQPKFAKQLFRNNQQERKLTIVVLLLVGILFVTILPYLLVSQIYVGYMLYCDCQRLPGLEMFMMIYFPIELLNFAVNPLIYAWRLPQYRKTLKYLLTRHPDVNNLRGYSNYTGRSTRSNLNTS